MRQRACGLFIYIPSGQNSRLYDQTCSVQRMCTNVIVQQKGVKFRPTAESVQSPYHKKGTFPYLQGTINLKAVSISLAEHPVCKQHITTFPNVAALTLQRYLTKVCLRKVFLSIYSLGIQWDPVWTPCFSTLNNSLWAETLTNGK